MMDIKQLYLTQKSLSHRQVLYIKSEKAIATKCDLNINANGKID